LQKSADGDQLALFIAAVNKLLIDVRGGCKAGSDCDMHSIVHNGIDYIQRFLGHRGAEQGFLKRRAGASEHMSTQVSKQM
jgi:hypothetical protein